MGVFTAFLCELKLLTSSPDAVTIFPKFAQRTLFPGSFKPPVNIFMLPDNYFSSVTLETSAEVCSGERGVDSHRARHNLERTAFARSA